MRALAKGGVHCEGAWAAGKLGPGRGVSTGGRCGAQRHLVRWVRLEKPCAPAGKGRLSAKDGGYYEGAWAAGERVRGREVSADGRWEYDGEWRGGQRQGQGVLHQTGLSTYKGAACSCAHSCCWHVPVLTVLQSLTSAQ